MAQYDFGTIDPDVVGGTALALLIDEWRDAVNSGHSGPSAPTYAVAGMAWVDTSATPYVVKTYDGASWLPLYTVNATTHTPGLASGLVAGTTKAVAGTDTTTAMSPADGVAQALSNPIWGVAGGTGDAITLTIARAPQTALADGMHIKFRATAANTGAATLNVTLGTTATGAKNAYKLNGTALVAGDIPGANAECDFVYNTALNGGAGGYMLLNPAFSTSLPSQTGNNGKVLKTSSGGASWSSALNKSAAVASTSGTSIDFTGVPPWAQRITVVFNGFSSSGTSTKGVQLGSGSVQTTGYVSAAGVLFGTASASAAELTLLSIGDSAASRAVSGIMDLINVSGNTWVARFAGMLTPDVAAFSGGSVTLSGALDRLRITTVNGTDAFDAGSIAIMWE